MRKYLFILIGLLMFSSTFAWWNANWEYRQEITIDNQYIDNNLTDYTVVIIEEFLDPQIYLNSDNGGGDIRLIDSDDSTALTYWVEEHDTSTNTSIFRVLIPSINSTSYANTTFYVYYGNTGQSTTGVSDVWNSDYLGAYYFSESDPSSEVLVDYTNTINLSNTNMESTDDVEGIIGTAYHYDGSNEYSEAGTTDITSYPFSMSAWIRTNSTSDDFFLWLGDKDSGSVWASGYTNNPGAVHYYTRGGTQEDTATSFNVNNWTWFKVTYVQNSASDRDMYFDNIYIGQQTTTITTTVTDYDRRTVGATGDTPSRSGYYAGYIDEVRYTGSALSAEEVYAEYYNYKRTDFMTNGGQEVGNVISSSVNFETEIYELETSNITLIVDYVNDTGLVENINILNLNYNNSILTPNYTSSSSDQFNATYTVQHSLLETNNSDYWFFWTYAVNFTNSTQGNQTSSNNTQYVYYNVYFEDITAPNVLEGETFNVTSNLTDNTGGLVTTSVIHSWNNTNYTTFGSYYNTLSAPLVDSDTTVYYQGYANVTYNTQTVYRGTSNNSQTIQDITINTNCGGVNVTSNFTLLDELEFTSSYSDVSMFINLTSQNSTAGLNATNVTYVELCLSPFNTEITASIQIQYLYEDYPTRNYFLTDITLTNSTKNYTLYMLNDTYSSTVPISLKIAGGSPAQGAILSVDKNPFNNVTYQRVDMAITGSDGRTNIHVEKNNYYVFTALHNGIVYDLGQNQIEDYEITNGLDFNLNSATTIDYVDDNIAGEYTNITASNQTVYQFFTTDGEEVTVRMLISRREDLSVTEICDTQTTSNSATLSCDLGNREGEIIVLISRVNDNGESPLVTDSMNFVTALNWGVSILLGLFYIVITLAMLTMRVPGFIYVITPGLMWIFYFGNVFELDFISLWSFTFICLMSYYLGEKGKGK